MLRTWGVVPDAVGFAQDLHRLYTLAKVAYTSAVTFSERELEMSERYREPPVQHEEPVWFSECDFDSDAWLCTPPSSPCDALPERSCGS